MIREKNMYRDLRFTAFFVVIVMAGLLFSCSGRKHVDVSGLEKIACNEIPDRMVPDAGQVDGMNFTVNGNAFVDAEGRTMFLRGINLGGSSKVPFSPNIGTHVKEGFFDGRHVSFTGRPFPLEDADEHFRRLKAWGFHFLRFIVTWEAVEHEGPGIYDEGYLDYIVAVLKKADEYGINVMIDPHQDVWSRFTGGDGAPLWTIEAAGMDVTKFKETGAAIVHNTYGDPFPRMIWYTNYYKLSAATMFTLFYGGKDFAPDLKVEGENIQEYLQSHYINALKKVAEKVKDLPNVIGFELMNEPSSGYIGIEDITVPYEMELVGDAPTPFESMMLGAGIPVDVEHFEAGTFGINSKGRVMRNDNRASVWMNGTGGLWQKNGVWKMNNGKPEVVDKEYFSKVQGRKIEFNRDYYEPFAKRYADSILAVNSGWFICVDNTLFPEPMPLPRLKRFKDIKWVNGSHWYDDITLFKKEYIPYLGYLDGDIVLGSGRVKKAFESYLKEKMITDTHERYGRVPAIVGEFGIPFDMNNGSAYRTGDYSDQIKALDRSFSVIEKNMLSYTLWNYTADNTNERGDNWNGEDLSIFSLSQQKAPADINSGGRALKAAVRPYPKKISGKLTEYTYDIETGELIIKFEAKGDLSYPMEIFIPDYVYGTGFDVFVTNGKLFVDKKENVLMYYPADNGEHVVVVRKHLLDN
jgi:hypothetical protein